MSTSKPKSGSKAKSGSKSADKGLGAEVEHVLGEPNDLFKLMFVVNDCLKDVNQWPDEMDAKHVVITKVTEMFDYIGEEAIDLCFEIAVNYGFIYPKKDETTGRIRYVSRRREELDLSHDWFCFDCDILVDKRSQQFLKCDNCFRVFHRKCMNVAEDCEKYNCLYCKRVNEWETDGHVMTPIGSQVVDQNKVNKLIGFLLDFLDTKLKDKLKNLTINMDKNNSAFIYKTMDLSLMRESVKRNEYKSVAKFEDDFFVYMHNLHINATNFSQIYSNFADLRFLLVNEVEELRRCYHCYEMFNDKVFQAYDKNWFCRPCDPPHELVFVKLKSFPIYPAKVIEKTGNKVFVRYFDAHLTKMEVKPKDILSINDSDIRSSVESNKNLVKSMQMLRKHEELLAKMNLPATAAVEDITDTTDMSFDETIETVVRKGRRGRKPKPKSILETPSTSSDKMVDSINKEAVDSRDIAIISDNISQMTTPSKTTDEKPEVEMPSDAKDKRRSGRLMAINQNKDIGSPSVDKPDVNHVIQEIDLIDEEMDTSFGAPDVSQTCDNTTDASQQQSQHSQSSQPVVVNNNTDLQSTDPKVPMNSPEKADTNYRPPIHNQISPQNLNSMTTEMHSKRCKTDAKQSANYFGEDFEDYSHSFQTKFNELMAIKEPEISMNVLKEKLILIDYYNKQQIKALKKLVVETRVQTAQEVDETKGKNWCVVCKELAKFYCCLRYYCGDECQKKDWLSGHHKQCLLISPN